MNKLQFDQIPDIYKSAVWHSPEFVFFKFKDNEEGPGRVGYTSESIARYYDKLGVLDWYITYNDWLKYEGIRNG